MHDAYLRECTATHRGAIGEQGIVLDRTVFYPLGGGQAGDSGVLVLADGRELLIADTRKAKDAEGQPTDEHLPRAGARPGRAAGRAASPATAVTARIDWERRHRLMRFHTTTHLLCHLVPQLVNGCSITPDYARLDFNMTDPLDKDALTARHRAPGRGRPSRGRRRHHRRGARRQPGAGQEHVGAAAARHRPHPHHPHRRRRSHDRLPALRRHPRGQHRRDRRAWS